MIAIPSFKKVAPAAGVALAAALTFAGTPAQAEPAPETLTQIDATNSRGDYREDIRDVRKEYRKTKRELRDQLRQEIGQTRKNQDTQKGIRDTIRALRKEFRNELQELRAERNADIQEIRELIGNRPNPKNRPNRT